MHTFSSYNDDYEVPFSHGDLEEIASLNPQIENFTFDRYQNPHTWQIINTKLKNLKSINVFYSYHVNSFKGASIQFNNIKNFQVKCLPSISFIANPFNVFSFKCLKNMTVVCDTNVLELWLNFILDHQKIENLIIELFDKCPLLQLSKYFQCVHKKLKRISKNTKFLTLRLFSKIFHSSIGSNINEIPTLLKTHQWIDRLSIIFDNSSYFLRNVSEMEIFIENVPNIENIQ